MRLKWFAVPAVLCSLASGVTLAQTAPQTAAQTAPQSPDVIPPPIAVPVRPVPPLPAPKPHLRDSFVYIYSYMDVREDHFGPVMLANMDAQLTADLKARNIATKLVAWKSTAAYQQQKLADDAYNAGNPDPAPPFRDPPVLPFEKVLAEKAGDEKASGARYRLVVFPKNFSTSGPWRYYQVVWNLYDIETNKKVWTYIYNGEALVWWRENENADKRAKKMVDTFIGELSKSGLDK